MGLQRVGHDWATFTFTHEHRMAAAAPGIACTLTRSSVSVWRPCQSPSHAPSPVTRLAPAVCQSLAVSKDEGTGAVCRGWLGDSDPRIYSWEARSRFWPSVSPSSLSQSFAHCPCPINTCQCTAIGVINAEKNPQNFDEVKVNPEESESAKER